MADLVITAANVVAGANAVTEQGTAGAAIAAGMAVYKDPATSKYLLADCDSAASAARVPAGIALNGAADGQPLKVIKQGDLTLGNVLSPGAAYYLSATPGGICPVADLASGDYPCVIGMAKSASVLAVDIQSPGVALP